MPKDRDFLKAFSGDDRLTAAQVADKLEQCARQNRLTHTMFLTPHQRAVAMQVIACAALRRIVWQGDTPLPSAAWRFFCRTIWKLTTSPRRSCPLGQYGSNGGMALRLPIGTFWVA